MDYLKLVKAKLKEHPNRLTHVLGVRDQALKLQAIYGGDKSVIETAALLHDYCKYDDIKTQLSMIKDDELKKQYASTPVVYHALAAAYFAKNELKIYDARIFEAIAYHIWGKIAMNIETMIIVVADFSEPNRTIKEAKIVRDLALRDLKEAYILTLEFTTAYLISQGIMPHEEQLKALEFYKEA